MKEIELLSLIQAKRRARASRFHERFVSEETGPIDRGDLPEYLDRSYKIVVLTANCVIEALMKIKDGSKNFGQIDESFI